MAETGTATVSLSTLEAEFPSIVAGVDSPRVLLKSDTQGHDAAVLRGAGPGGLPPSVVAVLVELAAQPIYNDQPKMTEVMDILLDDGFTPVAFQPLFQSSDGLRMVEIDGLFMRSATGLPDYGPGFLTAVGWLGLRLGPSVLAASRHRGGRLPGEQPLAGDDRLEVLVPGDGPDHRVDLRLEEHDQRDQLLVRRRRGRRQHAVPGGAPARPRPPGQQVGHVHRERVGDVGRVGPVPVLCLDLQAAVPRLPVQDRQDAPVGVRGDPELALLWACR